MKEILQYFYREVKEKRLSKAKAMRLIRQALGDTDKKYSLHPLLDSNASDYPAHRISTKFSGEEVFPDDHVVDGQRILPNAAQLGTAQATKTLPQAHEAMIFEEQWQTQESPASSDSNLKTIICFLSDQRQQENAANEIARLEPDAEIVFVSRGSAFKKASGHHYIVSASDRNSYEKALGAIGQEHPKVDALFYMWALEEKRLVGDCGPIVRLLNALATSGLKPDRLLLAGQCTDGLERCHLDAWIGFDRSSSLFFPGARLVAIIREAIEKRNAFQVKAWLKLLVAEAKSEIAHSVYYRNGKRHVCRIGQTRIEPDGAPVLHQGRTYLITGGCGGLGLLFARHLARAYGANLVLTGRSAPDREKQAQIEALEQAGAKVHYIQADVADADGMQKGLVQAKARFGAVSGVIHAAGVAAEQSIIGTSVQDFEKVLGAKIDGTLVLDKLLVDEPLDFVCYFSSSSAILGDFGSCSYAVANRFMAAHGRLRQEQKRPGKTVVIHWPLWQDGGMGFDDAADTQMYLKSSGQQVLHAQQGIELFEQLLQSKGDAHLVIVGQPERVRRFLTSVTDRRTSLPLTASIEKGRARRPEMKGLTVAQCVEWELTNSISKLLKIAKDQLDKETNLADFGFDSVMLAQFAGFLTELYEIEITPAIFFNHSTIEKLSQYYLKNHKKTLKAFYRQDGRGESQQPKPAQVPGASSEPLKLPPRSKKRFAPPEDGTDDLEPIAIIGMSGRFPEARNIERLWSLLSKGAHCVHEIPAERFDWRQYFSQSEKAHGQTICSQGGFIAGVSEFDPLFFEITPKEAQSMDPRQRLLLQESWNALEDAGYGPGMIERLTIGMFVGVEQGDYQLMSGIDAGITGNHDGVLAARLSYFLNLNGPALAINTACSSGLVAAHQACMSLRAKECDTAIAAGVNLILTPVPYMAMSRAGMFSEKGRCAAFDKDADGMVPGEAVVAVVLKRLSQAREDGDPIYAVIRGSGINYDGKTNGITAPSGAAQSDLLKSVYHRYRIDPERIEHIVTHGTGTRLGDPVEINALYDAFKEKTQKQGYCALTSTKSNFGHSFAASGLVSLIALVQGLKHETIPASLHCEDENDYINWKASPFFVNKTSRPWPQSNGQRRMGAVSAFGMSGTNAHLVVESAPSREAAQPGVQAPYYLLALSAKTGSALKEKIKDLIGALEKEAAALGPISFTLLEGRSHFNHRCAVVIQDREDAVRVLNWALDQKEKLPNLFWGAPERGFSGQIAIKGYIKELIAQCRSTRADERQYQEGLFALADFYCQGYAISAADLYAGSTPHRIHLPAYPFAAEHHWVAQNQSGTILPEPAELSFKMPEGARHAPSEKVPVKTALFEPAWREEQVDPIQGSAGSGEHLVMLCEFAPSLQVKLEACLDGVRCIGLSSKQGDIARRFSGYVQEVFGTLRDLVEQKLEAPALVQIVVPAQKDGRLFAALSGLLKTARMENPKIHGQLIEAPAADDEKALSRRLYACAGRRSDIQVRYENGQRYVACLKPVDAGARTEEILFKDNGVYLITGGAGGLGHIFAKEITAKVNDAVLILTGRSEPGKVHKAQIEQLEAAGAKVEYIKADVSAKAAVAGLFKHISDKYRQLDGIIHSAGVIKDNFILKKTSAEIGRVLAPKVNGTVALDEGSKDIALDFFILFSSTSAVIGNVGQADYACANAFMDAYAAHRNQQVEAGRRHGRTLSVNWPLWEHGGMAVDAATREAIQHRTGMVLLQTARGVRALYQAMASGKTQVVVTRGDTEKINRLLLQAPTKAQSPAGNPAPLAVDQELLREKILHRIKVLFSQVTQLGTDVIDTDKPLEEYGIDSMMITRLNGELAEIFGEISKTLFYQYRTLNELARHFITDHGAQCLRWTGLARQTQAAPNRVAARPGAFYQPAPLKTKKVASHGFRSSGANGLPDEPIAIIGMSGRYPLADDLDRYWQNLQAGKDCIRQIPEERWPLDGFFEPDKNKAADQGKSYSKWGGFLDGFADFDPLFFGISPREALNMDPQERLFVQACWQVFEDAGYSKDQLAARFDSDIGVFAGITKTGFELYGPALWQQGEKVYPRTSFSSVANRISFLMDFKGPSMPVDTMCSASLTAVHEACEHLARNACAMAVAGGVNLYLHPTSYIGLCSQQMLSSDGQCKSFGKGGNGFVPGEGVGAVLLKRLSDAQKDGDHIYAVIRATAINHGGKTSGYTVPNPKAQGELIRKALDKAGIDARTVSYIEAHGTGTELGDPIEISGLEQAFGKDTADKQFCAIGSAKSNIGHLEAAAGIAGLTKVVLQMQHQKIAASLHAQELNPNINFAQSPFVVQQKTGPWEQPVIDGQPVPRRAGLSSFGAGGSNAHVVIEEYQSPSGAPADKESAFAGPHIIVLSAQNQARLKEQARQLLDEIEKERLADSDLAHAAYTLQVGRQAMQTRLAMMVDSVGRLKEKLDAFLKGQDGVEDLYQGKVKQQGSEMALFTADEDLQQAIAAWIAKGKYARLLELWVKGLVIDWDHLYGDQKPRRISMPTYPFAKEALWIPQPAKLFLANTEKQAKMHPMVHSNTSSLSEQRFSSTFSGQEFFWNEDSDKGTAVLPSVAYLEMARAALENSVDGFGDVSATLRLLNTELPAPIALKDGPLPLDIALYVEQGTDRIGYEIYTPSDDGGTDGRDMILSHGLAIFDTTSQPAPLDIHAIKSTCRQSTVLQDVGIGSRVIKKVYVGTDRVLAKLTLPSSISGSLDQLLLHPGMLDGALQVPMALPQKGRPTAFDPSLPLALESLELFSGCTGSMWALARQSGKGQTQKLDIDLCDESGKICVRLKGIASRVLEAAVGESSDNAVIGTALFEPAWREEQVDPIQGSAGSGEHLVMLCEFAPSLQVKLEACLDGVRCIGLSSKQGDIARRFSGYVQEVFDTLRDLVEQKLEAPALVQIVVPAQKDGRLLAALAGLLKTAHMENPKIHGQLIEAPATDDEKALSRRLYACAGRRSDIQVRYENGQRYVACLKAVEAGARTEEVFFKDNGVYLITGGAGGLGHIFAKEICARVGGATLILTGRSALEASRKAQLDQLKATGATVAYIRADVASKAAVDDLFEQILDKHQTLDGIIHSAGVIKDNFILKKSKAEIEAVLAPKVAGVVNLDRASKDLDLDFFILFSSTSAIIGNVGQADYACANAFMDAYAAHRNQQVEAGRRHGRTLSVNWPLWEHGGMAVDAATREAIRQSTGMVPLQTASGVRALYQAMASGKTQVMVAQGDTEKINRLLLQAPAKAQSPAGDSVSLAVDQELLQEKALHKMKVLFSEVIKVDVDVIDPEEPLEGYGIDSILITQLNQRLDEIFGEVSKTLFYQYRTLNELVRYFITDHGERCMGWTGLAKQAQAAPEPVAVGQQSTVKRPLLKKRNRAARYGHPGVAADVSDEPIAIIGMSGRYPLADDLDRYWQNLQAGKDCIRQIPEERWALDGFFEPDKNKAADQGKSYSKWGGFLDGFADFDPLFFGISPREALNMDPQERLFVQACWQVFEDAGYSKDQLAARFDSDIGVFAGITKTGFELYGPALWQQGEKVYPRTSFSSVANRISFLMDFKGPSMPVDTMCSASLTAVHEACEHLARNACAMAVAGGVNLYLHPTSYIGLCSQQMLSSDGQCKSFGKGGNGFVPGEGVGAVLLKRLSDAQKDGDHIYAVIRATAINHGGKTSGYTVPNPKAQGELIRKALDKAGIDARTVSYIEAHGTGTELGDPIEISGLEQAFAKDTADKQFCAIGSAKSNIGHLEAAAGIAGLTKVVLQMQHQKIAASLHAQELNPNINFAQSPFVVQQKTGPWEQPVIDGQPVPRRAGLSSFGAGGSNAHVVIEEYRRPSDAPADKESAFAGPHIIVLSAQNQARLKEQARQLLDEIEKERLLECDLAHAAYTLQVGRQAMEVRLALLVVDTAQLKEKLAGFINGDQSIEALYHGRTKHHKAALGAFTADEDMVKTIDAWIAKGKYSKLLNLWVKGLPIDWDKLYGDNRPRRISLPAYPFAKERHWIPQASDLKPLSGNTPQMDRLHPLLHRNTSDFERQRFSSTFNGEEFFLADHLVHDQRVLPGVAYLEMARAAVENASNSSGDPNSFITLKGVVWERPVAVGDNPVHLDITLFPGEDGQVAFEIYDRNDDAGDRIAVRSQGKALLGELSERPVLDIETIKAGCSKKSISPTQCYDAFKTMGIQYGPAHQGIENIYAGSGKVLAKLALPNSVQSTKAQFVLHPSVADAALQASIGLMWADIETRGAVVLKPAVPYALEALEVFGSCTASMWALVRENSDGKIKKLDIDVCDENGRVCVRMKGFLPRTMETDARVTDVPNAMGALLLEPGWQEEVAATAQVATQYQRHLVILCQYPESKRAALETHMTGVSCVPLQCEEKDIDHRYKFHAHELFTRIKAIMDAGSEEEVLVQVVVSTDEKEQLLAGLGGLLKTVRKERPKIICQLIEMESDAEPKALADRLHENAKSPSRIHIRYHNGKRLVEKLREIGVAHAEPDLPWKDEGVYLITGGAGGLGLIFAGQIAATVEEAKIILTGRSALDEEKESKLQGLMASGARIEYRQVDVADKVAVTPLFDDIRERFGKVDGIIHSAGVIKDNFIRKKTEAEFLEVLSPKVAGLVNLDEASQNMALDFFVLFSSTAGITGNVGQADYACANAFMDAYAIYRASLVRSGRRYGKTLSINWPLWREGGMQVDEETEKLMLRNRAMVPMQTRTGIRALHQALATDRTRLMVLEGDLFRLRQATAPEADSNQSDAPEDSGTPDDPGTLKAKVLDLVKQTLANEIKLHPSKIDADTSFDKYGIDSVMQTKLINEFEQMTGELSKTLLFEYANAGELTDYFVQHHGSRLSAHLSKAKDKLPTSDIPVTSPSRGVQTKFRLRQHRLPKTSSNTKASALQALDDIAIIGISGRYPQADSLEALWEKLINGENCITQAPVNRWATSLRRSLDSSPSGETGPRPYGGFLKDIDGFDHHLFGISQEQVMALSPELRLFLEVTWETFEDAGYTRTALEALQARHTKGVGVFVGTMYNQYSWRMPSMDPALLSSNQTEWTIPNRASHFFNLTGPSIAVNSACSSSMTAIHLACESLKLKNCAMAIAGGVNLTLDASKFNALQNINFLGSGGTSKSFGDGDGYLPGEGVGAVLLKPLDMAIRDQDRIHGVIKSSFVNHSGGRQMFTAPDPKQQSRLIIASLERSGIDPETIGYVESAANGSSMGDPIEVTALGNAFGHYTEKRQYCPIGSVKSNIGHLEAASGISQLSKVLLQMKHKTLVPSINANPVNPAIRMEKSPFFIQDTANEWKRFGDDMPENAMPRRSMINSFGAGGAYANLIVEEFANGQGPSHPGAAVRGETILAFSAKTEKSLLNYLEKMAVFLGENTAADINAIAWSLQKLNHGLGHRAVILASSVAELSDKLRFLIKEKKSSEDTGVFVSSDWKAGHRLSEATVDHPVTENPDLKEMAKRWVSGQATDLRPLFEGRGSAWIDLPKYAFDHDTDFTFGSMAMRIDDTSISGGPNSGLPSNIENEPFIEPEVYLYDEPYLKDHRVNGERVLIGVTHGSLAINAFLDLHREENAVRLQRLHFIQPIAVEKDRPVQVKVRLTPKASQYDFQVVYRDDAAAAWELTATGRLQAFLPGEDNAAQNEIDAFRDGQMVDIEGLKSSLEEFSDIELLYDSNPAVRLGASFKTIDQLYLGAETALAKVVVKQNVSEENHRYALHPLIINSAFLAISSLAGRTKKKKSFLPFGIQEIRYRKTGSGSDRMDQCWLIVKMEKRSEEIILFSTAIINSASEIVAELKGCSLKRYRIDPDAGDGDKKKIYEATDNVGPEGGNENDSDPQPLENRSAGNNLHPKILKYLNGKIKDLLPDKGKMPDPEANLMELGLESSRMVGITAEIEKEADIELNPTVLFEYPSIKELAAYLLDEHAAAFTRLLGAGSLQKWADRIPLQKMDAPRSHSESNKAVQSDVTEVSHAVVASAADKEERNPVDADDIAIIGMSGRFAEADDLEQFWQNLYQKKDLIKEIPTDHWDYRPWFDERMGAADKTYCKWGSFIEGVDKFDAGFFKITPREAEWIDPQVRLLLQSIYATAEDAGCIRQLRGSDTGVFVGVCFHDYAEKLAELNLPADPFSVPGNAHTIVANRASFIFDLRGPSLAVDTACSSSLFALHYACQSLKNKECRMAFVGGTNLLLSSFHYRYFSSIGVLSPTGRCNTFDDAADGYVPGEAVGSILLKPLGEAIKDRDRIYALIKGSAALHGGNRPSLTAPSVDGEENVILKAWEDAGINPETISYIEAHGTGTKLGDPIEITSLQKAFRKFTNKENICAVGSAKAHVGHTEGASGITGILKIIMQMKHKKIPAMPMFKNLNPFIRLDKSALYINREVEAWKTQPGVPMRAGISSFGFSGSYAHVVMEDYTERSQESRQQHTISSTPQVILLSARKKDRLEEKAQRLLAEIKNRGFTDAELGDVAYTLQVGRETMEERLALIVSSIGDCIEKLEGIVEGRDDVEDVYRGQVKHSNNLLHALEGDEDMAVTIDAWIAKGKYDKLCDLWVKGMDAQWDKLHAGTAPRRISLPTYPFARERYWVPEAPQGAKKIPAPESLDYLHPLLHRNTSDLTGQRFSSRFTGEEFFLADHLVNGKRLLPGVACLEMARKAVEIGAGKLHETAAAITLQNVVWDAPFAAGVGPVELHIALFAEQKTGQIDFEIYSVDGDGGGETTRHNQGGAHIGTASKVPPLDIEALKSDCRHTLLPDQCYDAFKAMGMDYRAGLRSIEKVYASPGQVLAKLTLPAPVADTRDQFVLHPSIMDGALQAAMGLMVAAPEAPADQGATPSLLSGLESLEIWRPCTGSIYALVRQKEVGNVQKLSVDLCEESGEICARLRGVTSRVLEETIGVRDKMALVGAELGEEQTRAVSARADRSPADGAVVPKESKVLSQSVAGNSESKPTTDNRVLDIFCRISGLAPEELDVGESLVTYGFNSIQMVQVLQQVQTKIHPAISMDDLLQCTTLQDVMKLADAFGAGLPRASEKKDEKSIALRLIKFPELIRLSKSAKGIPVFWFHGGFGGTEPYQPIAEKSRRPFYGIQARGWMTDHSPLHGVEAMAAYYMHIIRSVQPEGPYDLGGYSLGGMIAYEVARLIQGQGERVNTIVMLDSLGSCVWNMHSCDKSLIMQIVNGLLRADRFVDPEKDRAQYIHRDEIDAEADNDAFLEQVVKLAKTRGMKKPTTVLIPQIDQQLKVLRAIRDNPYTPSPLHDPDGLSCYLFRNKGGLFLGDFAPYVMAGDDNENLTALDHVTYWHEWEALMPNLEIMDVDSENHLSVLSDPKALNKICAFCETLYSK